MPVTDDSEPTGSIIYRATIRFGLPTLVLGWTAVSVSLSGIVTALMIEVLWGNVHWTDLEFTSAVTCIVTVPIAYMIGKLMRALNLSRDSLKRLAQIDALTGLANRGYFFRRAEQLVQDQSATVWPLSALMIDVDHFKSINDESGHAAGDQVLAAVARLLEQNLRRDDFVAIYFDPMVGHHEFEQLGIERRAIDQRNFLTCLHRQPHCDLRKMAPFLRLAALSMQLPQGKAKPRTHPFTKIDHTREIAEISRELNGLTTMQEQREGSEDRQAVGPRIRLTGHDERRTTVVEPRGIARGDGQLLGLHVLGRVLGKRGPELGQRRD